MLVELFRRRSTLEAYLGYAVRRFDSAAFVPKARSQLFVGAELHRIDWLSAEVAPTREPPLNVRSAGGLVDNDGTLSRHILLRQARFGNKGEAQAAFQTQRSFFNQMP
jgi:hypothetical protein